MVRVLTVFLCLFMFAYPEEISIIPDFSYIYRDISDRKYENLEVPGFSLEENHKESGFRLNYVEIKLNYHLPYETTFYSTFHITEEQTEIDEIYLRKKIQNLSLKGGKFRSSIGIINSRHQHFWFFSQIPLIYQLLFSEHGLTEKGVGIEGRFNMLTAGAEILNGENEISFGYQAIDKYGIDEEKRPSLYTLYLKTDLNVGRQKYHFGISYLKGKRRKNEDEVISGNTQIYGLEFMFKRDKKTKIQGEYFFREIEGKMYYPNYQNLSKKQSGFYIQAVHYLNKKIGIGLRYDNINRNKINGKKLTQNLEKYSFCVNYLPVDHIKIRIGYIYNNYGKIDGSKKDFNEFIAEITLFLGKHKH